MTNETADGMDSTGLRPRESVSQKKNVLICDTQPVAVEGMKWLIENSRGSVVCRLRDVAGHRLCAAEP